MRKVEPIRRMETVEDIETTLSRLTTPRGRRMFLLWEVGTHTGLRIGDLLKLTVGDLRGKDSLTFTPQKQKHMRKDGSRIPQYNIRISLDPYLRRILAARCEGLPDSAPLFPSRKRTPGGQLRAITREQALEDMKEIARLCGIRTPIGCHTMRKTFGYHYYQQDHDVATLQKWFHHSAPEITLIYIGIADDNLRRMTNQTPFRTSSSVVL